MSEPILVESAERIEVRSPMRTGMRIVLLLLSIFPLIAPYQLLVRVDWQDHSGPLFLLAAFISAGAAALALFLVFAAIAGMSSQLVFDRAASTLTYSFEAPVVRRTTRVYPLSVVQRVDVEERTWSDGAPTYYLRVAIDPNTILESGSSSSRGEMQNMRDRIEHFIR